jgi:hypothetical protein
MQTLKIRPDGSIILPKPIFKPQDEIAFIYEGGTLILKKLNPPKISEIAKRIKGKAIPLKDIVKEIHLFRKEKKTQ